VVAVVIAVLVAVAGAGALGAVENQGHVPEALLVVVALQFGYHLPLQQSGAHDEDGPVGHLADDLGVGNYVNRRAVDEDQIVAAAKRLD